MNIWGLPGETRTSANRRLFLKNTEITSSSKSHASDAKWQKNVSCIKNELKRSKHETARSSNTHNALRLIKLCNLYNTLSEELSHELHTTF